MSYKKAEHILPQELLRRIQEYVDGESIYIPRKEGKRKPWGEKTYSKESTRKRNEEIRRLYKSGVPVKTLAGQFFLSPKSIQKILRRAS